MRRKSVIIRALAALLIVWLIVFGVRRFAGSQQVTSERVERAILSARLADWSGEPGGPLESARREKEIRKVAELVNRLDFAEREKNRQQRIGERFFQSMTSNEKQLFVKLTVAESMSQFMKALDSMPAAERRKFVEQGLRDIQAGKTETEMQRAQELQNDLLDTIANEGIRAYFDDASAETKLDLAPLMESMNELMQGMRGNEFLPSSP